jgi:hypothetical protein
MQDHSTLKRSQGLSMLGQLDPEVEFRSQLAESYKKWFSRVPEQIARSVFLQLWRGEVSESHEAAQEAAGSRAEDLKRMDSRSTESHDRQLDSTVVVQGEVAIEDGFLQRAGQAGNGYPESNQSLLQSEEYSEMLRKFVALLPAAILDVKSRKASTPELANKEVQCN